MDNEQQPTVPKKTRRSRKSYVTQEQDALSDAASAVEKKLDISQLKLISRRLETLAPLAADERQAVKEKNDLKARETALAQRVAELERENAALRESLESKNDGVEEFLSQLSSTPSAATPSAATQTKPAPVQSLPQSLPQVAPKPKPYIAVQEEIIERDRKENLDRQATMTLAWRSQMGLV